MRTLCLVLVSLLLLSTLHAVQVTGVVRTPEGKPAVNAVVALRQFDADGPRAWTTNVRGRFAVDLSERLLKQVANGLPAVAYLKGCGLTPCRLKAGENTVQLLRPATVRGQVFRPGGPADPGTGVSVESIHPKSGEYVYLPEGLRAAFTARTDVQGNYALTDLPPHCTIYLAVNSPQYFYKLQNTQGQMTASVDVPGGQLPPLYALPAAMLTGRVLDGEGAPVPGVTVRLTVPGAVPGAWEGTMVRTAVTSADGRYMIGSLCAGPARVTVLTGGNVVAGFSGNLGAVPLENVILTTGQTAAAPDITLTAARITGRVLDAATGQPLPAVHVVCQPTNPITVSGIAATAPDGTCILLVPPGTYLLYAGKLPAGYAQPAQAFVTAEAGGVYRVEFKARKTGGGKGK